MSNADVGNFVVISWFSAAPFPRLSVSDGAIATRVLVLPGSSPYCNLSAINTANASRVEITSAAFRPLAKTQGHSSSVTFGGRLVTSWEPSSNPRSCGASTLGASAVLTELSDQL